LVRDQVFFQAIKAGVPKLLVFQNPARHIAQWLRAKLGKTPELGWGFHAVDGR
jgi:hypothetical protein